MELWDLYNEKGERIGRDHIRGEEIPEGCYHLVVHVWIRNSKGEYLISQRSADRHRHHRVGMSLMFLGNLGIV